MEKVIEILASCFKATTENADPLIKVASFSVLTAGCIGCACLYAYLSKGNEQQHSESLPATIPTADDSM